MEREYWVLISNHCVLHIYLLWFNVQIYFEEIVSRSFLSPNTWYEKQLYIECWIKKLSSKSIIPNNATGFATIIFRDIYCALFYKSFKNFINPSKNWIQNVRFVQIFPVVRVMVVISHNLLYAACFYHTSNNFDGCQIYGIVWQDLSI